MKAIKKLIISIKSQIDSATEGFANHEALAQAAINEMEDIKRQAKLFTHRLKLASAKHQHAIQRLNKDSKLWQERALRVKDEDENKALECMHRVKLCQEQILNHNKALEKINHQQFQTQSDLTCIERKIATMRNKKLTLAAKQAHARTHSFIQSVEEDHSELESVFEQWEESVAMSDPHYLDDLTPEPDLNDHFRKEEEENELRDMLEKLSATQTQKSQE